MNSTSSICINKTSGDTSTFSALDEERILQSLKLKGSATKTAVKYDYPDNTQKNFNILMQGLQKTKSDVFNLFGFKSTMVSVVQKVAAVGSLYVATALKFLPKSASLPVAIFMVGYTIQDYTLQYRNKNAPANTWQYYSSHGSIWDKKTIGVVNQKTGYTDYVEIPYDSDGYYNMSGAIYIDGKTGKRNLTEYEKEKYSKW